MSWTLPPSRRHRSWIASAPDGNQSSFTRESDTGPVVPAGACQGSDTGFSQSDLVLVLLMIPLIIGSVADPSPRMLTRSFRLGAPWNPSQSERHPSFVKRTWLLTLFVLFGWIKLFSLEICEDTFSKPGFPLSHQSTAGVLRNTSGSINVYFPPSLLEKIYASPNAL